MAQNAQPEKPDVEPWLAVLWTVVWPGLGHFHARASALGFLILLFSIVSFAGGCWCLFSASGPAVWGLVGIVAFYLSIPLAALQVFRLVRRANSAGFEAARRERKDPWLAAFLSFLLPGMGHFYLRAPILGVASILLFAIGGALVVLLGERTIQVIALLALPGWLCMLRLIAMGHSFVVVRKPQRVDAGFVMCTLVPPVVIAMIATGAFNVAYRSACEIRAVVGRSMQPALLEGDRVVFRRVSRAEVVVGDIVVFHLPYSPERIHVMRVAAIGPCDIRIGENGRLQVGRVPDPLPEPLASTDYGVGSSPVRRDWVFVDVDECFVLGDNPERSADSRCYGVVPLRNIKGVVYKIFWPLDRAGPVDR